MKPDKLTIVRNWILDKIENGYVGGGEKLPTTREISESTGISLLIVQSAVESLSNEGALYKVPRHGVYVNKNWRSRILQRNVFLFDPKYELPYKQFLTEELAEQLPHLRIVSGFHHGMFEIRTTGWLQAHHDEYMPMTDMFAAISGNREQFAREPFRACFVDNKLMGIPIIYSPWLMFYNPKLLKDAGCEMPHENWTWNDFQRSINLLSNTTPSDKILNWVPEAFYWMNFIFRNGGKIIKNDGTVAINSPKTLDALQKIRSMLRNNHIKYNPELNYFEEFIKGNSPFQIHPREIIPIMNNAGFEDWDVAPLPAFENGCDRTLQATDIFCVRKECADTASAATLAKLLLSEKFQNFLAEKKYGIPIRLSSAEKSLDKNSGKDQVILKESTKLICGYNLPSTPLYEAVVIGINEILETDCDIDRKANELALMTKIFVGLSKEKESRTKQHNANSYEFLYAQAYHSEYG